MNIHIYGGMAAFSPFLTESIYHIKLNLPTTAADLTENGDRMTVLIGMVLLMVSDTFNGRTLMKAKAASESKLMNPVLLIIFIQSGSMNHI